MLNVTVLVTSYSYCLYVFDVIFVVGDNNRFSVRKLGAVNVGEYCITLGAVPELASAVSVAANLDCRLVTDLCGAGDNNVLSVGELGESCIGEYRVTLCAVPELNVTVLVAGMYSYKGSAFFRPVRL